MNTKSYTSRVPFCWTRARRWCVRAWEKTSFIAPGLFGIAFLFLVVLVFVGVKPEPQSPVDNFLSSKINFIYSFLGTEDKKEVMKQLGWIIVFTASMGGLWTANRRAKAMEDAAQAQADAAQAQADAVQAQAKSAQAQVQSAEATESGNLQQRFKDAIENLGSRSESVRIGGAHTLFHMALEAETLRASIADILCAHIRIKTRSRKYQEKHPEGPSIEIQSLMDLLFAEITHSGAYNREEQVRKFWKGLQANLSDGCFNGIVLRQAQFRDAYLRDAQFLGAHLLYTQFHSSNLSRAQFQMANLLYACFRGANLVNTNFWGAKLGKAEFQAAYLDDTHFQGAVLESVQFQGGFCDNQALAMGSFEKRINGREGKRAELSKVVFSGSVDSEDLEKVVGELTPLKTIKEPEDAEVNEFKDKMSQPDSTLVHQMLEDYHTNVGAYTEEDARRWIEEYERLRAID